MRNLKYIFRKRTTRSAEPFYKKLLSIIAKVIVWLFVVSIGLVVVYKFVPVYVTPLMLIRVAEQVEDETPVKLYKEWVPIEDISPNMIRAVVASEDNLFMQHNGFDVKGIKKAIKHNKKNKTIRGGSTITQQTAKNVFLFPNRSYLRKGLEAYFTVLIELLWSKERIMEVYLNVIETGDGVYGVEKAANIYYAKSASELTRSESAFIAVCLPNPRRFSPKYPSAYIKKRNQQILRLMRLIGPVDLNKE